MANMNENRREALKKIGLALAAATASGTVCLSADAQEPARRAAVVPRQFKIPQNITPALANKSGDFDVFFSHQGSAGSAVVLPSSDSQGIASLTQSLGAQPAKARVVNGVIHVGLGSAASRSSVARQGAISFRGATVPQAELITR
jgi:hypothetical protein